MHPLFKDILALYEPAMEIAPEKCVHDWQVTGHSYISKRAAATDPAACPQWTYFRCSRCGEELIEPF